MKKVNVSVTDLASYISRRGNLSGGSYGSVSGIEGTRLHQRVFSDLKKAYGDIVITEEPLESGCVSAFVVGHTVPFVTVARRDGDNRVG